MPAGVLFSVIDLPNRYTATGPSVPGFPKIRFRLSAQEFLPYLFPNRLDSLYVNYLLG
jgi:hypothetical protein